MTTRKLALFLTGSLVLLQACAAPEDDAEGAGAAMTEGSTAPTAPTATFGGARSALDLVSAPKESRYIGYLWNGPSIRGVAADGKQTVVWNAKDEAGAPVGLTATGDRVWWLNSASELVSSDLDGAGVKTTPLRGLLSRTFGDSRTPFRGPMLADQTHVYFARYESKETTVVRVPFAGGEPETVFSLFKSEQDQVECTGRSGLNATVDPGSVWQLAADATSVYVLAKCGRSSRIEKIEKKSKSSRTLVGGERHANPLDSFVSIHEMALDGQLLWFTQQPQPDRSVELKSISTTGGAPSDPVETGQPLTAGHGALTIDGSKVYVSGRKRAIVAVPKNGGAPQTALVKDKGGLWDVGLVAARGKLLLLSQDDDDDRCDLYLTAASK